MMIPGVQRRPNMLAVEGQKQRTIFDAHNTETLPGDVIRNEGGLPTGDPAADEAYDGLGATYDFFSEAYQRDSIDDEGMPLNATIHFGQD
jgi:Zn-dependent metalloprotease